jgi:CheY-like chemotaxis protein
MPEMDGHAVTRSLRTQGLTLPIVAFTAGTMKQDVLKCIESGYTTHLAKPFSKESFIDCLDRQLAASRRLKHSV